MITKNKIALFCVGIATIAFTYWFLGHKVRLSSSSTTPVNSVFNGACRGYESQMSEAPNRHLNVEGKIPWWVQGTLIRVGPAQFELGDTSCKYWFDGFAKVYRWAIKNGSVEYATAFLDTDYRATALKTGKMPGVELSKKASIFSRLGNAFRNRDVYDNVSVAPFVIAGKTIALTASPVALAFDQRSLTTLGPVCFDTIIDAHASTAHPIKDPCSGDIFNLFIQYGSTTTYYLIKLNDTHAVCTSIGAYSTKKPSFIHSFALTDNYVIIVALPYTVHPADMLFEVKPYLDYFSWQPELGTTFIVLDKKNGKLVGEYHTKKAFFSFNQINAFEKNDSLVLDMITYPDDQVIKSAQLTYLRAHPESFAQGSSFERFSIHLPTKKIDCTLIQCGSLELATINEEFRCKSYRYVYGVKPGFSAVCKVDLQETQVVYWSEADCYPGESIFVRRPGGHLEDDGVLMSVVLNAKKEKSFLLFLNARDMKELARADIQEVVPFNFHGIFIH